MFIEHGAQQLFMFERVSPKPELRVTAGRAMPRENDIVGRRGDDQLRLHGSSVPQIVFQLKRPNSKIHLRLFFDFRLAITGILVQWLA